MLTTLLPCILSDGAGAVGAGGPARSRVGGRVRRQRVWRAAEAEVGSSSLQSNAVAGGAPELPAPMSEGTSSSEKESTDGVREEDSSSTAVFWSPLEDSILAELDAVTAAVGGAFAGSSPAASPPGSPACGLSAAAAAEEESSTQESSKEDSKIRGAPNRVPAELADEGGRWPPEAAVEADRDGQLKAVLDAARAQVATESRERQGRVVEMHTRRPTEDKGRALDKRTPVLAFEPAARVGRTVTDPTIQADLDEASAQDAARLETAAAAMPEVDCQGCCGSWCESCAVQAVADADTQAAQTETEWKRVLAAGKAETEHPRRAAAAAVAAARTSTRAEAAAEADEAALVEELAHAQVEAQAMLVARDAAREQWEQQVLERQWRLTQTQQRQDEQQRRGQHDEEQRGREAASQMKRQQQQLPRQPPKLCGYVVQVWSSRNTSVPLPSSH